MSLLIMTVMTSLLFMACGKEPEKTTEQEPVAEKILFEEVKTQAINNPKDTEAWSHLADLYERSAMYREEAEALQKVIALRPRYAAARYNLGIALLKKGKRSEALIQYHELDTFDAGVAKALKKEIDGKGK